MGPTLRTGSRRRSSFLVDELDMLMDKAATTIQATWRGHLTRKRLTHEHSAASTIQAAWRHFITREYLALQRDQVPSWQPYRQAAVVIQAHYRGYLTRRAFNECRQAAITIQAHWRGYRTRQEGRLRVELVTLCFLDSLLYHRATAIA
uniref:Uncharacterized protein n=1 Tax=Salvator merianae TaxID=96440 RepID=A0A8D0DNC0_SALMN